MDEIKRKNEFSDMGIKSGTTEKKCSKIKNTSQNSKCRKIDKIEGVIGLDNVTTCVQLMKYMLRSFSVAIFIYKSSQI